MNEEELTKIVEELINPLRDKHIAFMGEIFETLQKVFEKGVEVGQKIKTVENKGLLDNANPQA